MTHKIGYNGKGINWTEELIHSEILLVMKTLMIDTMPTRDQIISIGKGGGLPSAICRSGGYSSWAKKLGVDVKRCTTRTGQWYEEYVRDLLIQKGYKIERMSIRHPYDLLVNDNVKIDIKAAREYLIGTSKVHTFGINKGAPTCDIYICIALVDDDKIQRILVLPSTKVGTSTICIGANSQYDKYIDMYSYIDLYDTFYNSF